MSQSQTAAAEIPPLAEESAHDAGDPTGSRPRARGVLFAIVFLGVGLIAAPGIFQMFTRAPLGKQMIDEFRPFMTESKIESFENYLVEIGAAADEADGELRSFLREQATVSDAEFRSTFAGITEFVEVYPTIQSDMGDMLKTMRASIDNFAAVDALPEFNLFPWFFVAPGIMVAGLGWWALARSKQGRFISTQLWLLIGIGLGLIAAPAVFQMFTRAPLGGEMINDFRSLMSDKKVAAVQSYFLAIGGGEGELRLRVPELLARLGIGREDYESRFDAIAQFSRDWPRIANEMAPMVGAMSDNIDNFEAVDALPPFPLFPWFFVAPGVLVSGLAIAARRK